MRVVVWLIFVLAVLATFYLGYLTLFWAWVTATPLSPAGLARAQRNFYFCLALTGASFVSAIVALILAARSARRKVRRGFDVPP